MSSENSQNKSECVCKTLVVPKGKHVIVKVSRDNLFNKLIARYIREWTINFAQQKKYTLKYRPLWCICKSI